MNNNLLFCKVVKNGKSPISNINDIKNLVSLNKIQLNKYNVGIPAKHNNLIILDIDKKNKGLEHWDAYIKEHGEPLTVNETTPSGGFHYYFLKDDTTYTDEENILISRLKCKKGYRDAGIDIRINAGHANCEPSTVDGKEYKFIRHYNAYKILKAPLSLLRWVLEFEEPANNINNNLVLLNNTKEYEELLKMFGEVDSKGWHNITKATKKLIHTYHTLKEHKIKGIWDKWSETQKGYDQKKNFKLWTYYTTPKTNFNYLLSKMKEPKFLNSVKPYIEMFQKLTIQTIEMNNNYIYDAKYTGAQITEEHFKNYDTIIIKSTTGTGKTSNTAKLLFKTGLTENHKIISIINRVVMVSQHQKSFGDEKIFFSSYQDKEANIEDDNIIICIDSILKYSKYQPEFFNNYIVYIDEISSLLNSLTHNENLNDKLRIVYLTLLKIINNCSKIIVSDATINDNVFSLLQSRADGKKLFVRNTFQKYKGIEVVIFNDENKFIEEMNEHIIKDSPFLCGSDSMKMTKTLHENALKLTTEDKTIIKTSTNPYKLKDAQEQFKNKFVFYSPSITTAVDVTYNEAQSVFIHIEGNTISPLDSFQQATRTRNIKKMFVYVNDKKHQVKYKDIEETKTHFKEVSEIFKYNEKHILNKMCFNIVNDEFIFNENSFFNLLSYNEYLNDTFNTNKKAHFINILQSNGFKVIQKGKKNKRLNKEVKKEIDETIKTKVDKQFSEHITDIKINDILRKNFEFLSVHNKETAERYKEILIDENKKDSYLNLLKLLKKPEIIKNKLASLNVNLTKYKAIYTSYNKVFLISQLEEELKIERFNFTKKETDEPCEINDNLLKSINTAFRVSKTAAPPTTYNKFIEYYIDKLNNLIRECKIIIATRTQENKKRTVKYIVDVDRLNYYLELYELTDPRREFLTPNNMFKKLDETKEAILEDSF